MEAYRQYMAFTPAAAVIASEQAGSTAPPPRDTAPRSESRPLAEPSETRPSPGLSEPRPSPELLEPRRSSDPSTQAALERAIGPGRSGLISSETSSQMTAINEPNTMALSPSGDKLAAAAESDGSDPKSESKGRDATPAVYVTFEESDPAKPHNWSFQYKAWVVLLLSHLTLTLTFASSVSAPTVQAVMDEFGCSEVAATATTGLFLVGMGFGAMPSAPLSELHGRLPVYVVSLLLATLFEVGCALAPNIGGLIVLRFLAGFFSAAPLSNAGGSLNDIGDAQSRTLTLPLFSSMGFLGPLLGPLVGGYIVAPGALGWRWAYWITAIWNALGFVLVIVFMPETLAPALLKYKAVRLRKTTGDERWKAKVEDERLIDATVRSLKRPFMMLVLEPIVIMFVLYLTVVYIVLFGSFTAYPVIFEAHGLGLAQTGLTYIPLMVGFVLLLGIVSLFYARYRCLTVDAKAGRQRRGIFDGRVEPEERLVPLMACGFLFPAGLFWLAWTSAPKYSTWLTMMSGVPYGIGLLSIFQGSYQYMIDAYGPFASSALACATLVRYAVSGLVILAFPKMYESLGTEWATTLLAFLGVALTPVPFVFYIYGTYGTPSPRSVRKSLTTIVIVIVVVYRSEDSRLVSLYRAGLD